MSLGGRKATEVEMGCGCITLVAGLVASAAFILVCVAAIKFAIEYLVK